jgi:superfamily II DNA or RNA helicase
MKKVLYNPFQLLINFDVIEKDLFLLGDLHNIKSMLPKLFETQQEDVAAAENRFKEGKGYLFTNGTGTGKTYVGLGIAFRFYTNNKKNIIIVVPTDEKSKDWVEDGLNIGLSIYKLQGIHDAGHEITVTTYANFYQNEAINKVKWDLVIYDESHYLGQNANGVENSYLQKHKNIANLPSAARSKAFEHNGVYEDYYCEDSGLVKQKVNKELYDKVCNEYIESTKVVFLSATPFAYHKSIKYADGALFEINEKIIPDKDTFTSYNDGGAWENFMMDNFGYRMKYNKLTIPETGVDQNLLERSFFESFKDRGVMSTRQLELEQDYSREFIIVDSEIGKFIDDGLNLFHDTDFSKRYPKLSEFHKRKLNYLFINQLLECIKAKDINERIKQHLYLNRKVVVFHNYNNANITHPFQFQVRELISTDEEFHKHSDALRIEILKFKEEYSHYWNLDLSGLSNIRKTIKECFPEAREFNGTVSKKLRSKFIKEFNSDFSMIDIILVQVKAGQEGISLHDRTGIHQRVLINLGLPTAPTQAIQTEGRIYRQGLKSNAIYEYATVQTSTERIAFATKIAERSKTAENLAMGNLARDLETAFKEGYANANENEPNLEQGVGGKESDRFLFTINEYEKTKTFYWKRRKRNSKTKAREGVDYFATPEPLGFKMVEWLKLEPNHRCLEPSAGHGAIARFLPSDCVNDFIEPSFELSSQIAINATGTVINSTFEDHHIINKYEAIVMNPPFGSGGRLAMEHIAKACKHLSTAQGAKIIAIIPNGSSMQKRLDEFFADEKNRMFHLTGQIYLPSVLFERAGTNVSCRIIRIETARSLRSQYNEIELYDCATIDEFFNRIEHLDF